jgi:nicotinamidase-related amidase
MFGIGLIDVQNDFMLPEGKLYVPGAEKIIRRLAWLAQCARMQKNTRLFFTQDVHEGVDAELKDNGGPFPQHCMLGTFGKENVLEIPVLDDIVFKKHCYDVFDPHLGCPSKVEDFIRWPVRKVILAGVVGNICVAAAAKGFRLRGVEVTIIEDSTVWMDIDEYNNEKRCRKELTDIEVEFLPSWDDYL